MFFWTQQLAYTPAQHPGAWAERAPIYLRYYADTHSVTLL